jgi:NAD(P)-dependent dehydrogenase (short-subunit alcohol dehydrogenase family)
MTDDCVLVTGGTGQLGSAIARQFGASASPVIVTSRSRQRAVEWVDAADRNGAYLPLELDLGVESSIRAAVTELDEADCRPTALVCNASNRAVLGTPFEELTHEEFTELFSVDIAGHVLLARELRRRFDSLDAITFLSSVYAVQGVDERIYDEQMQPTPIQYTGVKASALGVTRHLAARLAPQTRVNAVIAGGVQADTGQTETFTERYEAKTMLGRLATAEEVAEATRFLTSERASYITGESLVVDGGFSAF